MNINSVSTMIQLADALKSVLMHEDFEKLSVSEFTRRANINRKTFYYHFHSMNDLLKWTIERDTSEILAGFGEDRSFSGVLSQVMDYMERNSKLLVAANQTIGSATVRKFIYRNIYPATMNVLLKRDDLKNIDREYLNFMIDYHTEAVTGVLQNWLAKSNLRNRRQIAEHLKTMIESA